MDDKKDGYGGAEGEKTCIACGFRLGNPLLVLDHMPSSAQNIPGREELAEDREISLGLCQCGRCGLVQLDCSPVDYYRDVIRAGGFSTTMAELRRRQYEHLIGTYHLEGKKIIEAGCGRGEFLSVLGQFPVRACGIENRDQLVGEARAAGLLVWKGFADSEGTKLEGAGEKGPFDAFLSFNFLEHQPDPVGMLQCIRGNLSEGGIGLVTAPSLEYILKYDGYYELIRDHLAYYTFGTLRYVMGLAGFEVLEEETVNRDTLSVTVRKGKKTDSPEFKPVDVSGLAKSREVIGREVDALIDGLFAKNRTMALWGAGHQGFTLASATRLKDRVSYIIDSAPFKQGRYAPVSHIPIVAPEHYFREPADAILIVAPGYTREIAGIIRGKFGDQVEILALRSNHIETLNRNG